MVRLPFLFILATIFLTSNIPVSGQTVSWTKTFTGAIGKYPATLYLYKLNDYYNGYYYYNSREEPIKMVYGTIYKGKLNFTIYTPADDEETIEGVLTDKTFNGTWKGSRSTLQFTFTVLNEPNPFDFIYVRGSKKIKKKEEYSREELIYSAASIWPNTRMANPESEFLKSIIRKEFGEKSDTGTIGNIFLREKRDFLAPSGEISTYEVADRLMILYQNKNLLSLARSNYTDQGGAHGIEGTSYYCYDLPNKRQITLTDVLDTLTISPFMPGILEQYFRKKYGIKKEQPLDETLIVDRIPLTDNIFITGKGIGFNYVPLTLSAGEILIFVPYKEFEGFLKPAFKKLLSL